MRRRILSRKIFWVGVVAALVLLGWAVRHFATMGARNADLAAPSPAPTVVVLSKEQQRKVDEVAAVEERFRALEASHESDPAMEETLKRAINLQRDILHSNRQAGPDQSRRFERLEEALATLQARKAFERIAALEDKAGDSLITPEAVAALQEALKQLQEINRSAAPQRLKDFVRETRLMRRLENAAASPLRSEADKALEEAEAAAGREEWTTALPAYQRARDALAEVNQKFPRTHYADIRLLDRITTEIGSLESASLALEVEAREKGARAARAAGKNHLAAELFQAAFEKQVELNRRYARSRFASTQRVGELDAMRQTMLAQQVLDNAAALDQEAGTLIFKRQLVAAAVKIDAATLLLDQMAVNFPKSRAQPGALKIKLAYLNLRRNGHAAIQDQVYDLVSPVPGEKNLLMLRTEAPQELYTKVMNTNPSRNAGRALPVDSVEWAEAREFCQRLSWLLGVPVRLPRRHEFIEAVGVGTQDAWNAENSGGRSRDTGSLPANANGFFDLQGNVAEWLQPDSGDETAEGLVAGGSYFDAATVLQTVPVNSVDRAVHARHIGFRFVVEYPID